MAASDRAAFRFVVRGRVQGVGFRRSAELEARRLGLAGWVRNAPAGPVEGVAEGAPADLEAFALWLAHGPAMSRVEAVDRQAQPASGQVGFRVL